MSTPTPTGVTASTPEPVRRAAFLYGSLATVLVAIVGSAVAIGVLSSEQAAAATAFLDYVDSAIVPIGTTIVTLSTLAGGFVGSITTAEVGRRKVRPVPEAVATPAPVDNSRTAV